MFIKRWLRISLFNLLIVSFIGVILRYKIAFYFPFIDQKNLLHGHSHFAFTGWVSQALYLLLAGYLANQKGDSVLKKYQWLLYANAISAYGMLISFPVQGYGFISILFSTLSIIVGYVFAIRYWKDLNEIKNKSVSHHWFKAALFFNALSSFGAFGLAAMMATKTIHQNWYLAAVYFFLHFQYNGWFFFCCMGLITKKLFEPVVNPVLLKIVFWLFALACIPAYVLSALWLPMPFWAYIIVVMAAIAQLVGWGITLRFMIQQKDHIKQQLPGIAGQLLILSALALSIKLLLQAGSTIPSLSQLAFGFRPIVIGYLHLILLGVITLFLLGFIISEKHVDINRMTIRGIYVFTGGVIVNELLLMIQGIAAMNYIPVAFINELLLAAALILFTGLMMINYSQKNFNK